MNMIDKIALDCKFDVGQIMAEVLCPDYDGPELHQIVDAFNQLPKDVRQYIFDILLIRQRVFARTIIKYCVDIVKDVGSDECELITHNIESRFDMDNQLFT